MKLLLALFLFPLFVQAQNDHAGEKIVREEPFPIFEGNGYFIGHPPDWTVNTTLKTVADVFILAPLDSDTDKFRENVNVVISALPQPGITLDQYIDTTLMQLKLLITDYKSIESQKITIAKKDGQKLIYTATQGTFRMELEQYIFLTKDVAFIVTFTAEENKFASYQHTAEKILGSFLQRE